MDEKREQKGLYPVIISALAVLAVSGWSFVMSLRTDTAGGILDRSFVQGAEKPGQEEASGDTDTEAMAEAVITSVAFDTDLSKQEPSVTDSMIVPASEDTRIDLYMGEGTCADELLIVTVAHESDIDAEIDTVQKHLTDMQQSFQDYLPKEAKKINSAVILQGGDHIAACVTADADTARDVLKEQLK